MDRSSKNVQVRGGKVKIPQYPTDLFALGTKASSEAKRTGVAHSKPSTSHVLPGDRKREPSGSSLPSALAPPKKQKTGVVGNPPSGDRTVVRTGAEAWEMVALECDPMELVPAVLEANDLDEADRVVGLLCGAVRSLRAQRWKPDMLLYQDMCYLAKVRPSLFTNDCVVQALASLLRRDSSHSFKSKGNPVVPVLAANLLMRAFQDKKHWPELFLKIYVEDSLGERVWVDQEECSGFVNNIITALNTRMPPRSFLQPELVIGAVAGTRAEACPSPSAPGPTLDDDLELAVLGGETTTGGGGNGDNKEKIEVPVVPRYSGAHENVEQVVMEVVREQLNRRQPAENITRNFLRLMASCCGLVEVRLAVVPRLELWLQNPKLMRPAQELLMAVCLNCNTHSQRDVEVISQLVKIRLKTKAVINLYLSCFRELISTHPENLATLLKHTIYNELSTARNPNNMSMLAVMFQTKPEDAAGLLADIFLELLLNREDYLRPLRALLREVVRVLRHDLSLTALCRGLLQERKAKEIREFEFKERMFFSIVDLLTLCIFLGISPSVREASALLARGDKRELLALQNFQGMVAQIERDAVWWLHNVAPKLFRPSQAELLHMLHKILFVDHPEQYYNKDNWPPESERGLFMRMASEVPLLQQTLLCILLIGIAKDHPVTAPDALELADQVVKRAAALPSEGMPMLQADKLEIIDLVFNLTAYHHPDNINLPTGYCPPHLAITNLYWKAWIMLLMLAAHNPASFGSVAWEKYPTLRTFMEMCITNHFQFPPPTMSVGEGAEEARTKELQVTAVEKQQILEFETYLAAASTRQTITEQTSLLLCQLITLDPMGPPRQPPGTVLDQLKALNITHRLGHLLCRSRRPDFLLDIIQRQGTSQSMPWLADLVESSEGAFSHLPVQCLCEFLLSVSSGPTGGAPEKQHKQQHLLRHLQAVLTDPEQDPTAPCEVLEYFLRRLGSSQTSSRAQAIRGLKQVLSSVVLEEEPLDAEHSESALESCTWLLRALPLLPHFPSVRPQAVQALRQACQVENEPALVSSYICFLAAHAAQDTLPELADLVLDMAQLIVERSSIVAAILPSPDDDVPGAAATQHALMLMFHSFLQKAREPRQEGYPWSESQDQILVNWSTGEQATMHVLIVHAIIILLNYGPPQEHDELFESLLDMWFPVGRPLPKAYLVVTSEEALLIPDWLKLRMIRSNVDCLVDAALTDLEPGQLVLFIQSFGIPVQSMSKLLHTLDRAVTSDPAPVAEAVLDKSYMAQLVEVQHHRGARGGHTLVEVLHLEQPQLPEYQQEKSSSRRRPIPQVQEGLTSRDSEMLSSPEKVMSAMTRVFLQHSGATNNHLFKKLQRTLAMEMQQKDKWVLLNAAVMWLEIEGPKHMLELVQLKRLTAPLLRLLVTATLTNTAASAQNLSQRMSIILQRLSSCAPLKALMRMLLNQLSSVHQTPSKKVSRYSLEMADPMKALTMAPSGQLEHIGNKLMNKGEQQNCTPFLVESLARLLLTDTTDSSNEKKIALKTEKLPLAESPAHIGLLIDWLVSLEPELIGKSSNLQMQLLFGQSSKEKQNLSFDINTCRPYLLSLLTHRASWPTLHHCMTHLLASCDSSRYNASSVLDFMWALTCNPRLWQGRDRFTPKHFHPEDVLGLSLSQLLVLVDYVVAEAENAQLSGVPPKTVLEGIEARLPLLQQCLDEGEHLVAISRHLIGIVTAKKGIQAEVASLLLLLLYLQQPAILRHLSESERDILWVHSNITTQSSSLLDTMSHTLLTALTAGSHTHAGKDWTRKAHDYELLTRKMASVHPILVLRQLPMLAATLQGRVHLDLQVFRARHHLSLFGQVLGLLELLRPWLFAPEHASGLHSILSCYLALARQHGYAKDVATLLVRLVALLQAFVAADAPRASRFLQQHAVMLSDLQHMHPSLSGLRSLLGSLSLPRDGEDGTETLLTAVAVVPPPSSSPHYAALLQVLSRQQGDEVFSALQELEHLSVRKPSILEAFTEVFGDLLVSPAGNIRALAHTLLLRYMRHDPAGTNASAALASFMRCLESDQPDVLSTALDRMPELVVCAQEHGLPLLQRAFRLGMYASVNALPSITKAIGLLNVQAGC
ncbi:hypothetical protein R5R35_007901 [Gryllus longicercus]|uniref:Integrator complex subunit 1 n=1 Tax=Gryllus longicercus TaxID=2509291 RepID=A0AAN9VIH2_9ORTH